MFGRVRISISTSALALATLALLLLAACGGGSDEISGPAPTGDAPISIELDGLTLAMGVFVWQDAMPSIGDEAGACALLCVNGTIEDVNGGVLPEGIEVSAVSAVFDGTSVAFEDLDVRGTNLGPRTYEFTGRGGAPLEPGTVLDVVAELTIDGEPMVLRAPDATVERTQ